jgi:hypothetical protein
MDAIELAIQNKDINAFCIVSIDADYYSLALRLRENGKYVLGIGKENSKLIWQNSCNEFVQIENILKEKNEELFQETKNISKEKEMDNIIAEMVAERDSREIKEIIEYGLGNSRIKDDGWISFPDFGSTVKTKYPSFDPRTYNYKNLLQIIQSFSNEIEIKSDKLFPPNYWLKKI